MKRMKKNKKCRIKKNELKNNETDKREKLNNKRKKIGVENRHR